MKKIFILFLFITTHAVAQDYSTIKDNDHSDKKHKKYPSYVEIDTTLVKDPADVIVKYNSEFITHEGNRFYLPTKPFVTATEISITLTEKGQKEFNSHWTPPNVNTALFNKAHVDDFYKIESKRDSFPMGENYEAYVVIDTTKIKDLNKITVSCFTTELPRTGNKYKISFWIPVNGFCPYEITIIDKEQKHSDPIKFSHAVFGLLPLKKQSVDYEIFPEKKPQFNSKEYNSFDDYMIRSIQKENIQVTGKLSITYVVMADGTTRVEEVSHQNNLNDTDKEKIKIIATKYTGWTPGEDKGKKVNVLIGQVYDFK